MITPSCLRFIEELNDSCKFDYHNCLKLREKNFKEKNYKFRKDTKFIRDSEWKIDIPKQESRSLFRLFTEKACRINRTR